METKLAFQITAQPDDTTCGPSCLHAVYRYYGYDLPLEQVIAEVPTMNGGGTFAVHLANHALQNGFKATMFTCNLHVFDPTWFRPGAEVDIPQKLKQQARFKSDKRLQFATPAYIDFIRMGGRLLFEDLTPALIRKHLKGGSPIITGLSSTYLYRSAREYGNETMVDDDVRGRPSGHFVTLCGYDKNARTVLVADPYTRNPLSEFRYEANINRVLIAVLLGVITHDANLVIIRPNR